MRLYLVVFANDLLTPLLLKKFRSQNRLSEVSISNREPRPPVCRNHRSQSFNRTGQGTRQSSLKRIYLVETSAMKRKPIQLQHLATITRIPSGIAFLSVCVLVGLVAFFAGAHAQVATQSPAATATPAPTATPFPTFAPPSTPRP